MTAAAAGTLLAGFGALYATGAWWLLRRWREAEPGPSAWRPPVSVLKPLCGAEPGLYECLSSLLRQPYPNLQVVFGVRDAGDPAIEIVRQLRRSYPERDIEVVVDGRLHGENPKASNLINMLPFARHPVVLISDSDVLVGDGYLDSIVHALAPHDVGAVTCLYRGRGGAGLWSRLAALFVNDWFFPAVLVSRALGDRSFASGATIALRRETLAAIGGFRAISDHLADDWVLCKRIRSAGLRTVLCPCVVEVQTSGESFAVHAGRELRWMRAIRAVAPLGYAFMGLSLPLPVALVGIGLGGESGWTLGLGALALAARVGIHVEQRRRAGLALGYDLLLVPLRDALLLAVWVAGLVGRNIDWRGRRYRVQSSGLLSPIDGEGHRHACEVPRSTVQ